MLRMTGELLPIKFRNLGEAELESYVTEILSKSHQEKFRKGHDIDFSYVSEEGNRFRVNVFRKDTGVGAVFRTIPNDVPSLDSLNLPAVVRSSAITTRAWCWSRALRARVNRPRLPR